MKRQKIAIVGSGISGLGAAYLLNPHHDITVYEKNDYLGGHSRTIDIPDGDRMVPVDTGFIVFNDWNYPHLNALFNEVDVPYEKSDMSFGVSIHNGWLEYSSNNIFGRFENLKSSLFWGMIADVIKFNRAAPKYLEDKTSKTLGQCLDELNLGPWFRQYYLQAMGAAIWSCSSTQILDFPAQTYIRFFKNHGLLNILNRPQWYTVTGGSREYVQRLTMGFHDKIRVNCGVQKVVREDAQSIVHDSTGEEQRYDHIIFACHADEAIHMLDSPTTQEQEIIGAFSYQKNQVITHCDDSFMPQDKSCWSSWVYLSEDLSDHKDTVSLSYWMNNLQNLKTEKPVIVTLNPGRLPDADKIYDQHEFDHPIFDHKAIKAQKALKTILGENNTWYCGAYQRYGFHEDGLMSAIRIVKKMGVPIPWA